MSYLWVSPSLLTWANNRLIPLDFGLGIVYNLDKMVGDTHASRRGLPLWATPAPTLPGTPGSCHCLSLLGLRSGSGDRKHPPRAVGSCPLHIVFEVAEVDLTEQRKRIPQGLASHQ